MSDADLRCMRWPFGLLCLADMAHGACRETRGGSRAVCWLHTVASQRLGWLTGGPVRVVREAAR